MKSWIPISIFFFSINARAISANDVVSSSLKHFPKVVEAIQIVEENESQVKEARGSFDATLKGEVNSRTEGFYTGDAYKAYIEKPFPVLSGRIYGGKRQSYGDFPAYEGQYETLSQGETFAGVSLSLLRDSLIDKNRYNLLLKKEDLNQSRYQVNQVKINVQTMALHAYWTWLIKGQELKVYQNILNLAQKRAHQISRRIKAGDLARIYEAENNQYIRKRQSQILMSQLEFQRASYYLSLFYRDKNGKPVVLAFENLPKIQQTQLPTLNNYSKIFQIALDNSLDLKVLNSREEQANLDVRLGNNAILPKVDVNYEWNQNKGMGPNRLAQSENRIMLKLEVPIEYNKGIGKKRAGKAKISQIQAKAQWVKENLRVSVQSLMVKLNSFSAIFNVTADQVKLAGRLADAERRKFSQGASDLILVNLREENLAEAQVKNLISLLKYHMVDAEIKDLRVEFVAPH